MALSDACYEFCSAIQHATTDDDRSQAVANLRYDVEHYQETAALQYGPEIQCLLIACDGAATPPV